MLRKKKKIYKILSVLVAVIIAFSLFSIPASAETVQTLYTDFWTLNKDTSKVWRVDTLDGGSLNDITKSVTFSVLSNGKIMGVRFNSTENWGADNILYFNFVFDLSPQYTSPGASSLKFSLYEWNSHVNYSGTGANVNTGEVYAPWSYRDGNYQVDGNWKRDYQEVRTVPVVANSSSGVKVITYDFETQIAEYGFNRVCVFAYCTLTKSLAEGNYQVYFEFAGLDYRYSTTGEYLNQQIIENQNENTQAIIDNQNELYEQEKQEITDSGNQATDAAENIPDKSEGFVAALKTFVSTMSTTSTECELTFPAIKIPAVPKLWSEMVLSEEKEIDISAAVELIPDVIMRLIRDLTFLGLLVFCFKEFYDTISEALTRKKASSDG